MSLIAFLFIIVFAIFFLGIITRTRSILSGRKGPRILQPMYNVILLLRKGSVFSTTSSAVTQLAPLVAFASTLVALLVIPLGHYFPALINFEADFVLFAYLLALGRLAYILNALDSGSAFGGMGAAREALFGMLIEPALFLIMGSLALLSGYSSFTDIFGNFHNHGINGSIMGVLAAFILFNIMLVETGRIPIDDSKTHLELTMIHEAMVLDNSGFDLALIHISTYLKFSIFSTLIANCLVPQYMLAVPYLFSAAGVVFGCAALIGFYESFRARYPMPKNASYLLVISSISLIALLAAIALTK